MTSALKKKVHISAQDLIRIPAAVYKNGLLRKKGNVRLGKWPYRFVVLANHSIYVYANETSKCPKPFSLVGYNRVRRELSKSHEWCFSILPAQENGPLKTKTFACYSDGERKAWMKSIRQQLYAANKIPKPESEVLEKLRSLSISHGIDNDEYNYLEDVVFSLGDENAPNLSTTDPDSDSDSSDEGDRVPRKQTRSFSLPTGSYDDATSILKSFQSNLSSSITESDDEHSHLPQAPPVPCLHKGKKVSRNPSDPTPKPPRYSEVMASSVLDDNLQEETDPGHDYFNLRSLREDEDLNEYKIPPASTETSLEAMCTVHDNNPDRDDLITRLQSKKEEGTYLIRNSRSGDSKVISCLGKNQCVKEFLILGSAGNYTIDKQKYFHTIDEFLKHYTNVEHIPNSPGIFLRKGFHQI